MKKLLMVIFLVTIVGCSTAVIPNYLPENKPYTQRFQAGYDRTLGAVEETLADLGWQIEQTLDPLVYEQDRERTPDQKDVLIITGVRQTPLFIGTRYAKMNVYIRSGQDVSEVEVRYITVTSLLLRNFTSYSNNSAARRVLEHIKKLLGPAGS